ncbi:hypothetical protein MPER_08709 [Moniliophthora perniciosa FA553]|nr:hypothetical protein MPER_08709 [Moniliophthora perniciosa FA553]
MTGRLVLPAEARVILENQINDARSSRVAECVSKETSLVLKLTLENGINNARSLRVANCAPKETSLVLKLTVKNQIEDARSSINAFGANPKITKLLHALVIVAYIDPRTRVYKEQ